MNGWRIGRVCVTVLREHAIEWWLLAYEVTYVVSIRRESNFAVDVDRWCCFGEFLLN